MTPILYPASETAFSSNGLGFLSDAISCAVTEEINSKFELVLKYPVTGLRYSDIDYRTIILAQPDPITDPQPFRVYRMVPGSAGTVTVYARHLAYDLLGIPVEPFTANGIASALAGLKDHAAVDCPFDFETDKTTAGSFALKQPTALWRCLGGQDGSMLDTFGGEYEFDRWTVRLLTRRGSDRGVTIRYGKNLTSLEQDKNCAEVYAGVYPFWKDSEENVTQLDSPIVQAEGTYSFTNILPLDCTEYFAEQPTQAQLKARAKLYMEQNEVGVPRVSWKIQFVSLEQTDEYRDYTQLERVLLGDTVSVIFPELNVNASARVVSVDYDPVAGRYNSITLGSVRSNMARSFVQQSQKVEEKPSRDWVQSISMLLTSRILGAQGGAVRLLDTDADGMPDTLYVADDPDPNKAVKVWRWNYEGWAGSKTGYAGPYIMGATLEDGLLANAVTTANLVAGTIQSGDDGKTFFLDLTNGVLRMNATELSIAGKTVDTIITDKMTQQEIFNALTNGGETQGIYLQDGKIYLNAEYIQTGFLEADYVQLNGLFKIKGGANAGYTGGYIGYMEGDVGVGIPMDGVAMYNTDKTCYFVTTDAGVRMQAGDFSLYMVPDGKGPVVNGALSVNGDFNSEGSYVKLENWRYSSNSDSTETALESWLDGILANMADHSVRDILVQCYPAVTDFNICARLYRNDSNYATMYGFGGNRKLYIKSKNNGTWKATESMAFS